MSLKLMQLIGNYTVNIREAKDLEEIQKLKESLYTEVNSLFSLQGVVPSVYVVTETDDYGRQLFRGAFSDKEQAKEYLAIDNLKEDNINEITHVEFD